MVCGALKRCVHGVKMCKEEPALKELEMEKQDEEQQTEGNGFRELIDLVTKTILQNEMTEITSALLDFRKNLSNCMATETDGELLNRPVQMVGIAMGMKESWKVWKEAGADKKKASYEEFKKHIVLDEQ